MTGFGVEAKDVAFGRGRLQVAGPPLELRVA
jgi:hypothetical protein